MSKEGRKRLVIKPTTDADGNPIELAVEEGVTEEEALEKGVEFRRSEIVVTRSFRDRGVDVDEDAEEEALRVHKFVTTPAQVTARYGLTLNLGNYESARVDVEVTVPCYVEEIEEAYAEAITFVEEKIRQDVDELRGKGAAGASKEDEDEESPI